MHSLNSEKGDGYYVLSLQTISLLDLMAAMTTINYYTIMTTFKVSLFCAVMLHIASHHNGELHVFFTKLKYNHILFE